MVFHYFSLLMLLVTHFAFADQIDPLSLSHITALRELATKAKLSIPRPLKIPHDLKSFSELRGDDNKFIKKNAKVFVQDGHMKKQSKISPSKVSCFFELKNTEVSLVSHHRLNVARVVPYVFSNEKPIRYELEFVLNDSELVRIRCRSDHKGHLTWRGITKVLGPLFSVNVPKKIIKAEIAPPEGIEVKPYAEVEVSPARRFFRNEKPHSLPTTTGQ